jgi:hypothetical protein
MIKDYRESRHNIILVSLICVSIVAIVSSLFFYTQTTQNNLVIKDLDSRYLDLINTSTVLRSYYDELHDNYKALELNFENLMGFYEELQIDLAEVQNDYLVLENRYASLLTEKEALQVELDARELDDLLNLRNQIVLEENKTLEISPNGNATQTYYETTDAGFIQINISSSTDIIVWIGSSMVDGQYYARLPPSFPETITEGSFIIPTCGTTYIHVRNPSEQTTAQVVLTITYTY